MGTLQVLLPTNLVSLNPSLRTANPSSAEGWVNILQGSLPSSDADIIAGLESGLAYYVPQLTIRNITAVFAYSNPNALIFKLDGAAAIKLSDLPPGFVMRGALTGSLNAQGLLAGSVVNFSVTFGENISGVGTNPAAGIYEYSAFVNPGVPLTPSNTYILPSVFMAHQLTISISGINSADFIQPFGFGAIFGGDQILSINGDYVLETGFQWNLDPTVSPVHGSTPPAHDGSRVTVTSSADDPNPIDWTQVTTVTLHYKDSSGTPHDINVPPTFWITIEIFIFIFVVPDLADEVEPPPVVKVIIAGTQFSGTIELGKLTTIYFVNAPGIYTLTPNATHDTLYDVNNGGTVTVKIPDPFAKTGFIGG